MRAKNEHGVITVLVALMLTGILSLGTLAIEAGRFQAARAQLHQANISAGTSMIAMYNSTLFERYGLLAVDRDSTSVSKYMEYLTFNSDRAAGYKGNNISTLYTVESTEMEGYYNLTYPSVLKRQILSRAKYNIIPQDYSFNYYNMDFFLSELQRKAQYVSDSLAATANGTASKGAAKDIPAEMQTALNKLYSVFSKLDRFDEDLGVKLNSATMAILPSTTGTVKHEVPAEDIKAINEAVSDANSVLGTNGAMLVSGGSNYRETDATLNTAFISSVMPKFANANSMVSNAKAIAYDCRTMVQGVNAAINVLSNDKEGNLLLNSYIAGYFSNRTATIAGYSGPEKGAKIDGNLNNANFISACAEYVFSGNASETANQQKAYDYIMAVRLVNNLYSVMTNSKAYNANNASSVAAHIAWAYYETYADAELLAKYDAVVPFSKYNMILPVNSPASVSSAFGSGDFIKAMDALKIRKDGKFVIEGTDQTNYRDAIALSLWFVPNSNKLLRVADLIQLEMRYNEQHVKRGTATFKMSEQNTFYRVRCTAKPNSVLPVIAPNGEGFGRTQIQSIKYIGY